MVAKYINLQTDHTMQTKYPGQTWTQIEGADNDPVAIIVGSQMDALLLSSKLSRKVSIFALSDTATKPDKELSKKLKKYQLILIALSNDQEGARAAEWWLHNVSGSFRTLTPTAYGKTIATAVLNGMDADNWLSVSMLLSCENILKNQSIL